MRELEDTEKAGIFLLIVLTLWKISSDNISRRAIRESGIEGLGARDQRYDVLKHAGIGKGKCPKIECLLKEVGL